MSDQAGKLAALRSNSPLSRPTMTLREVESLARMHTHTAIKVLAAIAEKADAPEAARVAAANSLLDRGWGKARQVIQVETPLSRQDDDTLEDMIRRRLTEIATSGADDAPLPDPANDSQ